MERKERRKETEGGGRKEGRIEKKEGRKGREGKERKGKERRGKEGRKEDSHMNC